MTQFNDSYWMVIVTKDDYGQHTVIGYTELDLNEVGYIVGMTVEEIVECQFVKEGEADYDKIFTELQSKYRPEKG
ncbi:hypothetical protein [Bacillus phage vB_Bpu_PumA2]|uniref:Uncharacterized protein n=1 Tax=Bacillus phage vB_Bpu_PumA2 TaxID=2662128 RepID=A0A5Q2WCT6_9CAUD|nr:hypothetical protein [Bacillus subtilis]YP_009910602.1 hypothetical protein H3021_gp06 [Bacillus phage vB_Bpu_PumA2]QGH74225.1 hypothetical protein [Bacillus phage vB_Bpu_PumA2]